MNNTNNNISVHNTIKQQLLTTLSYKGRTQRYPLDIPYTMDPLLHDAPMSHAIALPSLSNTETMLNQLIASMVGDHIFSKDEAMFRRLKRMDDDQAGLITLHHHGNDQFTVTAKGKVKVVEGKGQLCVTAEKRSEKDEEKDDRMMSYSYLKQDMKCYPLGDDCVYEVIREDPGYTEISINCSQYEE